MKTKKVSIIVTLYNSSLHIQRCLISILNQTYRNIEIIIVDDGSIDNSIQIVKKFADEDSRIIYYSNIHKGVSAARNFGIEKSNGEFIFFVDSDDFLSLNIIEWLVSISEYNKSDISIFGYYYTKKLTNVKEDIYSDLDNIVYSPEDALLNMLYQLDIESGSVGKLYSSKLFAKIRFNESISYAEDLEINSRLFMASRKIIFNPSKLYYYVQHKDSTTKAKYTSKRLDAIFAINNIYPLSKGSKKINIAINRRLFIDAFAIIQQINMSNSNDYTDDYSYCVDVINECKYTLLKDSNASLRHRLAAFLAILSPGLLILIYKLKSKPKL